MNRRSSNNVMGSDFPGWSGDTKHFRTTEEREIGTKITTKNQQSKRAAAILKDGFTKIIRPAKLLLGTDMHYNPQQQHKILKTIKIHHRYEDIGSEPTRCRLTNRVRANEMPPTKSHEVKNKMVLIYKLLMFVVSSFFCDFPGCSRMLHAAPRVERSRRSWRRDLKQKSGLCEVFKLPAFLHQLNW